MSEQSCTCERLRSRRPATAGGAISAHDQVFVYGLANGLGHAEIGELLGLSPDQVRRRVQRLMSRVGAHTAAQLVAIAAGRGQLWL